MSELKKALSFALLNNGAALICRSKSNENDSSVEIGIQNHKGENEWLGRHHLTSYDLHSIKDESEKPFDITQHEFYDCEVKFEGVCEHLICFEVSSKYPEFNKKDIAAIAKALGLTAEDLK